MWSHGPERQVHQGTRRFKRSDISKPELQLPGLGLGLAGCAERLHHVHRSAVDVVVVVVVVAAAVVGCGLRLLLMRSVVFSCWWS